MQSQYIPAQIDNQSQFYPEPTTQDNELFQRNNDLKVIQEYNREENMPISVKTTFWALASKSIKLGFWEKGDEQEVYFDKNNITIAHLMSKPKHEFTFGERLQMLQVKFLTYCDYKRGVGMEKHKINERTLQASTITQNIQGSGSQVKRGGVIAGLSRIFG